MPNFGNSLFNDISISSTDLHKVLKLSQKERCELVADMVNNSNEQFLIWGNTNEECDLIAKMITGAVNVQGKDKPEMKASNLLGFAQNKFRVLVTKPEIASFGMNYQNCCNQVF